MTATSIWLALPHVPEVVFVAVALNHAVATPEPLALLPLSM
ncbi:hypothetical protein [Mycobacteroides abscessus]|nr:hypothetical protein [Mycobacteroides abscessus]